MSGGLPFETWIHICIYLPVQSICKLSETCRFLYNVSRDSMLWRELLRRDFSDFVGAFGLDLLQKQENSLTLSQSISSTDWGEAPWQEYYAQNYAIAHCSSLAWVSRFMANIDARQDHAGARCGDYLVVYAGFTNDRSLYVLDTKAQIEDLRKVIADPSKDIQSSRLDWHQCQITGTGPHFLGMLYGHTLVTVDSSTLLLYGGMQAPGYRYETSEVWLLRLEQVDETTEEMETDSDDDFFLQGKSEAPFRWKWEKPPITGNIPHARAYHSAAVNDGKLWIFGGTWDSQTHDDFWCLDLHTWKWEEIACEDGPSARMGHSCTKYKENLIIMGGTDNPYCQGYGEDFSDVFSFDTTCRQWKSLCSSPGNYIGRRHAAVLLGNRIIVIAGSVPHTNNVALFSIDSETWHVPVIRGQKPSPRVSLSAHFCNGLVFVFGGCTYSGLSQELFLLDPCDTIGAIRHNRIEDVTEEEEEEDQEEFINPAQFLFTRGGLRLLTEFTRSFHFLGLTFRKLNYSFKPLVIGPKIVPTRGPMKENSCNRTLTDNIYEDGWSFSTVVENLDFIYLDPQNYLKL